ncbi:Aspartic proteinase nepenthesin-1 [Hordeum vulgare]|nr:Aspartic proteinase nepenthesin-1 [Hordeum vulgare]
MSKPSQRFGPPMHTQVGGMYSVVTSVGTGAGRRTYVLALDMTSHLLWMQCNPLQRRHFIQHPPPFDPANSPSFRPYQATAHYACVLSIVPERTTRATSVSVPPGMAPSK